jgi:hypothetical protein
MQRRHYIYGLLAVLLVALVARVLMMMSNAVSFHSDEAVVALMARHITLGERPVFFYGQAYMGSLDAWVIAFGFQVFGESVQTIRLMQSALFLLVVGTGYHAAWVLSRRISIAVSTGLLYAVGPVLLALYTTATLGGYNETLIFGHLIVALGFSVAGGQFTVHSSQFTVHSEKPSAASDHLPASGFQQVTSSHELSTVDYRLSTSASPSSSHHPITSSPSSSPATLFALGVITGLAWWTNALIVVYALPVGLFLLWRLMQAREGRAWRMLGLVLVGFVIGSAPWWVNALQTDLAPLRFLLPTGLRGDNVGAELTELPFLDRVIGLVVFGLPTVVGLRFPWEAGFFLPVIGLVVLVMVLVGLYRLFRARPSPLQPAAASILLGMVVLLGLVFLLTRFSSDPSGRYFLPLTLPFFMAISTLAFPLTDAGTRRQQIIGVGLLAGVLVYFAAGQIVAARGPYGLTTQFNTETHLPHDDDAALIDWLLANDYHYGYTNYWISFRIVFLSAEQIRLSAALPDKSNLLYTPAFERLPAYREASDASDRIVYITALLPTVETAIETWLEAGGIRYQIEQIGIYRVYYDFTPRQPRPPIPFAIE